MKNTISYFHASALTTSRDGAMPAQIELMPIGKLDFADRRAWPDGAPVVARVDDAAALIAASLDAAPGNMLPIDFGHGMDGLAQSDPRAAGWITGLDVVGNRIMASVEWTDAGEAALRGRTYRFISPTFGVARGTGLVTRIIRAGLTNAPALPDLAQVASQQETSMNEHLVKIREALGLPDDSDEAAIVTAAQERIAAAAASETIVTAAGQTGPLTEAIATGVVAKMTASSEAADPEKFVPMAVVTGLTTQLAALRAQVTGGAVETVVTAAMQAGKLTPAMKGWATDLATKNMASFTQWEKTAPVICAGATGDLLPALKPVVAGALSDDEKLVCASMGVSEEAFIATRDGKMPVAKKKEA